MSKNRNQHYVPRLLLKRFLTDTPRGRHLFRFVRGEGVFETPLSAAGAARGFYRDGIDPSQPDALDDYLRTMESKVNPILEAIVSDYRLPERGSSEFHVLARFIRELYLRTPLIRSQLKLVSPLVAGDVYGPLAAILGREELDSRIQKFDPEDVEEQYFLEMYRQSLGTDEELSVLSERILHLNAVKGSSPEVLAYFYRRNWRILVASDDSRFVVGDEPVVIHDGNNAIRTGLRFPKSRVSLALSPFVVLQGCYSALKKTVETVEPLSVRKMNGVFVRAAQREVFASSNDFEWQHVAGRKFNSLDWITGGPDSTWPSDPE